MREAWRILAAFFAKRKKEKNIRCLKEKYNHQIAGFQYTGSERQKVRRGYMRCFHNGNIVQFLFILGAALLLTLILPVKFILFILTVLLIYLGFIILTRF